MITSLAIVTPFLLDSWKEMWESTISNAGVPGGGSLFHRDGSWLGIEGKGENHQGSLIFLLMIASRSPTCFFEIIVMTLLEVSILNHFVVE